jgi:GNAT superfamily N-acetyltransferase
VSDGGARLWVPPATEAGRRGFTAAVLPHLVRDEALHNLHLAVLDAVATGRYGEAVLAAALDARGEVTDVLIRTPPHPQLIAAGAAAAAREALLRWLLGRDPDLPAMVGPLPDVEAAAAWWAARRGVVARRHMHQGIYALRAVRPGARAVGRLRLADAADAETVAPWLVDFQLEALRRQEASGEELLATFLGGGVRRLFLWEAPGGAIVALAGRSGRTPTGVRIGPVYTPPEHRGRGYGEAVVAAVAQRELDEGASACYLFTDLGYGASNRLYGRVGYELVGESAEIHFDPA